MKITITHDNDELIAECQVSYDKAIEVVNALGGVSMTNELRTWVTMNIYEGHRGLTAPPPRPLPPNVTPFRRKV